MDLYDVYLIISNEEFSMKELAIEIRKKLISANRSLDILYLLKPEYLEKLEYAYYKIKLLDFPEFKEIVDADVNFILPLIDSVNEKYNDDTSWDKIKKFWEGKISGSAVLDSLEGIVCKESASGILDLSTFPPYPLLVYTSHD